MLAGSINLKAAMVDVTLPPSNQMHVISSDPDPDLPGGYGTFVHVQVQPGDTLRIQAGSYKHLLFWQIRGTADKPITIVNHQGQVICDNDFTWSAITLHGCQHIHFTELAQKHPYGLKARTQRNGVHTFQVVGDTHHVEVDHVEVFWRRFCRL